MKKVTKVILAAALVLLVFGAFTGAAAAYSGSQGFSKITPYLEVGAPIGSFYGYQTSGVYQDNAVIPAGVTVQVKGDDIAKVNTTNALTAMQASTPGVNITQSSSQPGKGFKVSIRGLGTIGESSPLLIIDGVAGGSIESINPADIESIDVLKDAASAAIYGSRAANSAVVYPVTPFSDVIQTIFSGFLTGLLGVFSFFF